VRRRFLRLPTVTGTLPPAAEPRKRRARPCQATPPCAGMVRLHPNKVAPPAMCHPDRDSAARTAAPDKQSDLPIRRLSLNRPPGTKWDRTQRNGGQMFLGRDRSSWPRSAAGGSSTKAGIFTTHIIHTLIQLCYPDASGRKCSAFTSGSHFFSFSLASAYFGLSARFFHP